MLTVNVVKTCALLLLIAPAAVLAGGSDGGGSSKQGKLLDTQVREKTIEVTYDEELNPRLNTLESVLNEALPDFGNDFMYSLFAFGTKKRFIKTESLPDPREADVKHFASDHLVGLQRGQNIWVEEKFWDNAPMQERLDFVIHEFLVGQKLKHGPLSDLDKEEILHVSAELSENLNAVLKGGKMIDEKALQSLLETNHFLPGPTKSEYAEIKVMSEKISELLQKACYGKKIDFNAAKKLTAAFNWIKYESSDELLSAAKRRFLKDLNERMETYLSGKRDIQSICRKVKESDQVEIFDQSLTKPATTKSKKKDKASAGEELAPESDNEARRAD